MIAKSIAASGLGGEKGASPENVGALDGEKRRTRTALSTPALAPTRLARYFQKSRKIALIYP
jgi:hypothetical protein